VKRRVAWSPTVVSPDDAEGRDGDRGSRAVGGPDQCHGAAV